MTDPRKTEADRIKQFTKEQGAKGLIQGMFFQDTAIRYLLGKETKEAQKLRQSLIDIINGEDPTAKLHQKSVDAHYDSIPPKAEHGFLPMAAKSAANMDHQIKAIKYLTRFIDTDDVVYQTIWEAAKGKKSNMGNVEDAAINAIAHQNKKRKQELKKLALDPQVDKQERWTAYKILAFYDMTSDEDICDLVCDLADDHRITDLYKQRGQMSPNAKFWYESDKKLRKEYPEQHKDGKTDEQIKQDAVDQAQADLQEGIFEVIGYMIDHRDTTDLHNCFIDPTWRESGERTFKRFDSSRLTTQLCNLLQRVKGYRLQVLCKYWKLPIKRAEVEQVRNTLEALKHDSLTYSSQKDWIDGTLNSIDYKLRTGRDR